MGQLFNLDNKFFQGMNKMLDCVCLNLLWLICCIPLITAAYFAFVTKVIVFWLFCIPTALPAGAATTALYYAINKTIRHGRGYIWREFWGSFRSNFKQAAVISVILTLVMLMLGLDAWLMHGFAENGQKVGMLYFVFLIFILLVILWANYVYAYLARFSNGTKAILKNGALMAVANLPMTGMLLVVFVVCAVLVAAVPVVIMVVPSCYMLIENQILEKVFRKYMTPEEIAAEEERNQEFYN